MGVSLHSPGLRGDNGREEWTWGRIGARPATRRTTWDTPTERERVASLLCREPAERPDARDRRAA
jgi:hypothetical protein